MPPPALSAPGSGRLGSGWASIVSNSLDNPATPSIQRRRPRRLAWLAPASLAVGLLAFLFFWNDFINPLLYLKSTRLYTLPVGLMQLAELDKTNWPLLMAASALVTLPAVIVFLWLQRALLGEPVHSET